jgi:hypothetical protein
MGWLKSDIMVLLFDVVFTILVLTIIGEFGIKNGHRLAFLDTLIIFVA